MHHNFFKMFFNYLNSIKLSTKIKLNSFSKINEQAKKIEFYYLTFEPIIY